MSPKFRFCWANSTFSIDFNRILGLKFHFHIIFEAFLSDGLERRLTFKVTRKQGEVGRGILRQEVIRLLCGVGIKVEEVVHVLRTVYEN